MSLENCLEIYLEYISSVQIYDADRCTFNAPSNVALTSVNITTDSEPVVVANMELAYGQILMSDYPTLKLTTGRSSAGMVYTHDLQVPIQIGRELAEVAVNQLQGVNYCVVYGHLDGSNSISFGLPNTFTADIEESFSSSNSHTLKLKLQSLSPLIKCNFMS